VKAIWKAVAVGVVGALVIATTPKTARAEHRRDNDTAVAIVAGVAVVGIIAAIASHHDADVQVSYSNYRCAPSPPPRYEPPPRRIRGHYETRREKIVHPGFWKTVIVPAEYGWVGHGCHRRYVVVKPECHRRVWVPERCEWIETKVWVPGRHDGGHRGDAWADRD